MGSEREAAESLAGKGRSDVAPEMTEATGESKAMEPEKPPKRHFKWLDTSTMTIEHWLAGMARGDIEVFKGQIYKFREPTNVELRERDRYLNSIAPEFTMRGIGAAVGEGDRVNMTQWGRLKNIGTLVQSIESLNEQPWPQGKNFDEKFKAIEKLGWILTDRLVEAYMEFEGELMFLVRSTDLPNS